MPRRMLTSDIWAHEDFHQLSHSGRLFFVGMVTIADDDGRLKASPSFLRAKIFPSDNNVTDGDVKTWRDECHDLGLICIYNDNSIDYLVLTGWYRHQQIRKDRYHPSPLPSPPVAVLSAMRQPSDNQSPTNVQPDDNQLTPIGSPSVVESSVVESSITTTNPFEFWMNNFENLNINDMTRSVINNWIDLYGEELVIKAMVEMKAQGKRSIRYCEKILLNWEDGKNDGGGKRFVARKAVSQGTPRTMKYRP